MLTCEQAVEMLLDFIEENLSPELRHRVEAHVKACKPCVGITESYRKTIALCRKALAKQAPPEFTEKLMVFLREQAQKSKQ